MAETSQSAKPQTNEFPFSVSVGQVYDGPLDLLLDLVRKQDIDIYDIPIAKITAQYLGYVENLKHLDVDIAAEFIYGVAADPHQEQDAAAARSGRARRAGRPARRAGAASAGAREIQECRADAHAKAA